MAERPLTFEEARWAFTSAVWALVAVFLAQSVPAFLRRDLDLKAGRLSDRALVLRWGVREQTLRALGDNK